MTADAPPPETRSTREAQIPDNWLYRHLREPVNALTHFVGILLSIVGAVMLLVLADGEPWRTAAFAIYGVTLVLLFTASTLLHALKVRRRVERVLRTLDHAAIFLLIAGSYTPIALVTLLDRSPTWGWTLFGVAWGFALLGVVFKLVWLGAPRWISTGLYLAMGWLALAVIVPIARALPTDALMWLVLGGLLYSVGAVVYATKRPDPFPRVFGYHEIWHLFVLAGSFCHFMMMLQGVLPIA